MKGGKRKVSPDTDPGDETQPQKPPPEDIVRSHVEERFRHLGFNELQAETLADAGVDWHEAERLIDKGCDHLVALDILT